KAGRRTNATAVARLDTREARPRVGRRSRADPSRSDDRRSRSASERLEDDMRPFRIPRYRLTSCCGHGSAPAAPRTGRRGFLTMTAAGVAGLAATLRSRAAAAQVRAFPPPPPAVSPVEGLIDFHLHSAPDVFGRAFDDEEAAALYRDNAIEAVVMKSHVVPTADRAWFARKHLPAVKAFGGVVLNA